MRRSSKYQSFDLVVYEYLPSTYTQKESVQHDFDNIFVRIDIKKGGNHYEILDIDEDWIDEHFCLVKAGKMNWIERSSLGIMFSVPVQSKVVSVKQKQEVADPKKQFLKRFQQKPASPKYDRRSDLEILNSIVHSSDREFDSLDDGNSQDDEYESILEEETTESDQDQIDLPSSLNESTETSRLDDSTETSRLDDSTETSRLDDSTETSRLNESTETSRLNESTGLTETFHLMMLRHQLLIKEADDEKNEAKLPDSMKSIKCYQTPVKTILQDSINIQTPGYTQDEGT
ncbi:hypothetical protein HDV02_003146 [Globomyces sp. JEL0801]|nr:hypothetical protein HDV02_003146 [Globomyces sp. JEL0801]